MLCLAFIGLSLLLYKTLVLLRIVASKQQSWKPKGLPGETGCEAISLGERHFQAPQAGLKPLPNELAYRARRRVQTTALCRSVRDVRWCR